VSAAASAAGAFCAPVLDDWAATTVNAASAKSRRVLIGFNFGRWSDIAEAAMHATART
jgi:hypothetical protein